MNANNLVGLFQNIADKFGEKLALMEKRDGTYEGITYKEFDDRVRQCALGLASLGIAHGDRVALIAENRPEWPIVDLGILSLGAINVPLYTTLTPAQIEYILADSGSRIIVVSTQELLDKVLGIFDNLPSLQTIIHLDDSETSMENMIHLNEVYSKGQAMMAERPTYYDDAIAKITPDDLCGIIYTSGTTGAPKGVMLSHGNICSNVEAGHKVLDVSEKDTFLSFLPLCHSFERMVGQFAAIYGGSTIAYAESTDTIPQNLLEVKPTIVATVPRVLEKVYTRVIEKAETGSSIKRKIFWWALDIGEQYVRANSNGKVAFALKWKYAIATKLVFQKLKDRLGGRMRFFASGGAPLPKAIGEFFHKAGILILEGYGLTETSPVITVNREDNFQFGAVGLPIPDVEVKIAEDGEVLSRGPHIMKGYYRNADATAEAIDSDGWLYTGDIGYLDDDGFLHITDRKKNIIVTSGGKNVTPASIESRLLASPYIEQVMVVGDGWNYLTALIVPSFETLEKFAADNSLNISTREELLSNEAVYELVDVEIKELLTEFARFEQIKKFRLMAQEFTIDGGELTPTMKIKRKEIAKKYADEINALYEN